jgi:serine/threonine protein kinase
MGLPLAPFAALPSSWRPRYVLEVNGHEQNPSDTQQILLEQRYGRAVDWWAFGVLTYEMLLGQSPFRGDDEDEIFDAILEDEPLYPITMPRDAVSILQKVDRFTSLHSSANTFVAFNQGSTASSGIRKGGR